MIQINAFFKQYTSIFSHLASCVFSCLLAGLLSLSQQFYFLLREDQALILFCVCACDALVHAQVNENYLRKELFIGRLSDCQTVLVELLVAMVSQRITAEELALLIRLFLEKTPPTVNSPISQSTASC